MSGEMMQMYGDLNDLLKGSRATRRSALVSSLTCTRRSLSCERTLIRTQCNVQQRSA